MNEWNENLSPEENGRCQAALLPEERVLLVAKPYTRMDLLEVIIRVANGAILAGGLGYVLCVCVGIWWLPLLVTLPFWALAVALVCSPWLHRRRRERTVYLLTDKRVLVLEPGLLFGARVVAYPLQPNPVKEVRRGDSDYGDIIFGYEHRWKLGTRIHRGPSPVGFMAVPQVDALAAMIAEQVAATPRSALLPSALPPSFAGLPTATDSWGNYVPVNPNRGIMVGVGAAFSAISLIFLILGILMLRSDARFEQEAVRTAGSVVSVRKEFHEESEHRSHRHHRGHGAGVRIRIEAERKPRGTWLYYPTYQFSDAAGNLHQFESNVGSTRYNFPIGHPVEVMYLPANPAEARLFDDGPGIGLVLTLVGGFVLVIGGGVLAGGLMMKKS